MNDASCRKQELSQEALKYLNALYGYAMTLTRSEAPAEDLVQETYLKAIRAFDQFVKGSNLKAWMFTIMRNIHLNEFRRNRNVARVVEIGSEPEHLGLALTDPGEDPYLALVRKTQREGIRKAIEALPELHREIVILRDVEGFSYQEIATVLDCPAGTVMSRLARARGELRAILGRLRVSRAAGD